MRWMITDSGLGGLSVCAGLEHTLSALKLSEDIELLYVNATPEDLRGYNSLETQAERIALFDRFLDGTVSRFQPDEIAIACNTLSVIYNETQFARTATIPVKGIVGAGVDLCEKQLEQHPDRDLIIFATETTTEAGTYPRLINSNGARVISQECPELAHAISNDASGTAASVLLDAYIVESLRSVRPKTTDIYAFLGCTHYGYQADLFQQGLQAHGYTGHILNPNQVLVDQLLGSVRQAPESGHGNVHIRFVSRYPIPDVEIQAMGSYLKDTAFLTLKALQTHEVIPDLFVGFQ